MGLDHCGRMPAEIRDRRQESISGQKCEKARQQATSL
jgi:hypothetical protein